MVEKYSIKVKITPSDYGRRLDSILPIFTKFLKKEIDDYAKESKKIFQRHIPLGKRRRDGRSRSTRSSVKAKVTFNRRKMEGTIRLTTDNPDVIKYQDKGTGYSPGRYVPGLNRRIKTGMHPGVPALNIIEKTKNDMEMTAEQKIRNLKKNFGVSIRQAFK